MFDMNRQSTAALKFPRTRRNRMIQNMTSFTIGKMVPLAYVPLLREDSIRSGRMRINFQLQETAEILMNPMRVTVRAYLVSHAADPRFEKSMDQLNRSYAGQPQVEGGDVVPFIETHAYGTAGSKAVYKALGLHAAAAKQVNTWPLKAYNLIWNFLAKNRSADLTPRDLLDWTLAPAFWHHSKFAHIKPTFDAAVAEGEVALNVVNTQLAVTGIGIKNPQAATSTADVRQTPNVFGSVTGWTHDVAPDSSGEARFIIASQIADSYPAIYATLPENGITVSLANIDMARTTQHFSKLRERFDGHDDDWIIDNFLMEGLEIPDLAMTQPILLGKAETVFAQALRYATDSGNLDESATNGATFVDLSIRWPKGQKLHAGGVIMVVAEVLPEQLWERQRDPYFHSTAITQWPDALSDTLDPQKVEEVFCSQIDTAHSVPNDVFGYAPLNWEWDMRMAQLGGRFYASAADGTFDEDRQRFYAIETVDPTLSSSFYICEGIHQNPFLNGGTPEALVDVVDATSLGNVVIEGLTVFGPAIIEANGNWDAVEAKQPNDRIEQA